MGYAENIKSLPGVSHIAALRLFDEAGNEVGMIENKAGQNGSLAVYNHLAQLFGAITPEAARKGLELYAEQVEEAKRQPGKHPHIDRLLAVSQGNGELRVKHVFAVEAE